MRYALVLLAFLLASARSGADYQAGVDAYQNGDYESALAEFRALADMDVVLAYTNLGYMYALGEGVKADMAEAATWFLKAAKGGSAAAQVTVGVLYFNGEGVERNYPVAYAWFNVAATGGRDDALEYMSLVVDRMAPDALAQAQKQSRRLFDKYGDSTLDGLLQRPESKASKVDG